MPISDSLGEKRKNLLKLTRREKNGRPSAEWRREGESRVNLFGEKGGSLFFRWIKEKKKVSKL